MPLTAEVENAIEELRATFPDSAVTLVEDGSGGAFVKVDPIAIGDRFNIKVSWLGFHLTYQYPEADVYPHFSAPGLTRADGTALEPGDGFQQTQWGPEGRLESATQFSRRSARWDASVDTAADKLLRIIAWLRG